MQAALSQASSILEIVPDNRAKLLGMIVRGIGGGKTRLLEDENRIESHFGCRRHFQQ